MSAWVRPGGGDAAYPTFSIHRNGRLLLRSGDRLLADEADWPDFYCALQRELETVVLQNMRQGVAIHAGVVSIDGRVVLLPAKSGSGKTSLVRELLRQGAAYYSDEFAIAGIDGMVHPFARPLIIRDAAGKRFPLSPDEFGALTATAPQAPRAILFLVHRPGERFRVEEADQSSALLHLLANTPQSLDDRPEAFRAFLAASRSVRYYRGVRGDAAEAAAEIIRIVEAL